MLVRPVVDYTCYAAYGFTVLICHIKDLLAEFRSGVPGRIQGVHLIENQCRNIVLIMPVELLGEEYELP